MLEDFHAARVLLDEPDNKIKLLRIARPIEIVIAVNANNIEHRPWGSGISYDQKLLRLIDKFNELGIFAICCHHPCWITPA